MSDQVPTSTRFTPGWPELPIDERALARFSVELAARLDELEQRFGEPRQHPRLVFLQARGASQRPR